MKIVMVDVGPSRHLSAGLWAGRLTVVQFVNDNLMEVCSEAQCDASEAETALSMYLNGKRLFDGRKIKEKIRTTLPQGDPRF